VDYADEPYVRLFISDTVTWELLSFEAQTVLLHMLKGRFDRSGIFEHGRHAPSRAVTARTKIPLQIAEAGVAELVETGTWVLGDGCIVWPTFVAAQNTPRSDKARAAEYRQRRATAKVSSGRHDTPDSVTEAHGQRDETSQSVTERPHSIAEQSKADGEPNAAPAAATPGAPRKKRAKQIPKDWQPSSKLQEWCRGQGLSPEQIETQRQGFIDYWQGEGKPKVDWEATFRNRIRSGVDAGRIRTGAAMQQAEVWQ
jgi:hypothetical protein